MTAAGAVAFSVCICTRNRPDDLRSAIQSVARSGYPVHQLVVSDDSTTPATREMVAREFPWVTFVEGPRRGLSANRNTALAAVTGTHVLFIDDDVLLTADFLGLMAQRIGREASDAEHLILTGPELNRGERVPPHRVTFLGFQALDYRPHDRMYSIVVNSTVFPAGVFKAMKFDENLIYGGEEVDFASRAVLVRDYRIEQLPAAMNEHYPSPVNRDYYLPFMDASRIYVTFKRYYWMERRRLKALAFLVVVYAHSILHNLKAKGLPGLRSFATTFSLSSNYIRNCFRARSECV
jgi:glycosyltransferase involved in cell wall biosynthesis